MSKKKTKQVPPYPAPMSLETSSMPGGGKKNMTREENFFRYGKTMEEKNDGEPLQPSADFWRVTGKRFQRAKETANALDATSTVHNVNMVNRLCLFRDIGPQGNEVGPW